MKKVLIIVAVLSLMCAVPAFAGNQNASFTGGDVQQQTANGNGVNIGGDNYSGTNAGGDISNKNTNTLIGGGNATSVFGDANSGNINDNNNTNTNENDNYNKNTNMNTNLNSNKAEQDQDQKQAQGQAQGQSQSANNKQGQAQSTNIKIEADEREFLGTTAAPVVDARVKDTKASKIRGTGSLLDRVEFLTMSMAVRASKNASDMDVEAAVLFENDFELDRIRVGQGEVFGGYIYVFSDGTDSYLAAMDAEASEAAMKLGMTHIVRLGEVGLTKVLDGSSWNIGFSGGASLMASGDEIGIAPNGGLGFGKARTSSEFRPDAVYEVSYSADLIREIEK